MQHATFDKNTLFFHAIAANAIFSTVCGLVMILAPERIAIWLGLERTADILATGIFLLGFAAFLLVARLRGKLNFKLAWAVVVGDLSWVIFSLVLVTGFASSFSTLGIWLIVDVAITVGVFAALQARGLLNDRVMEAG